MAWGLLQWRPSAPLMLGVYSGAVSALAVLPLAFLPLINQWTNSHDRALERAELLASGISLSAPLRSTPAGAMMIVRLSSEQTEIIRGDPMLWSEIAGQGSLERLCEGEGSTRLLDAEGHRWAWSCAHRPQGSLLVAVKPNLVQTPWLLAGLLTLAMIVGIITAMIVLRVLRPLNEISTALARVGAGERSVRVPRTGLAELDDLIDRVNSTAFAMEQREDEITSRIKTAQRVARTLAHEVRNPLQSIEILTRLLVDEENVGERRRTASAIRQEVRGLDQVVSRILRRSIGEEMEIHPSQIDLAQILHHLYRLHEARAQSERKLLTLGVEDDLMIVADSALVGRAVENLLLNALQHSRGQVSLSASRTPGAVCIDLEDDGEGINPQIAARLFEPNVSHRPGGSGLGLALVKAVADAHGGAIEVSRSALGGARFSLHLPNRPSPSPAGSDEAATWPETR